MLGSVFASIDNDRVSGPLVRRLGVNDVRELATVDVLSLDCFFPLMLPGVAMPLLDSRAELLLFRRLLDERVAGMPLDDDIDGRGDFGGWGNEAMLIVLLSDGVGCCFTAEDVERNVGRLLDDPSDWDGVVVNIGGGRLAVDGVRSFDIN